MFSCSSDVSHKLPLTFFPPSPPTLPHTHIHLKRFTRSRVAYRLSHSLPPLPCLPADTQCRTTAKADIVLLVDGSWSIGRMNFKTIRNFIARMVSVFDIGPDKIQIGNVLLLINLQP